MDCICKERSKRLLCYLRIPKEEILFREPGSLLAALPDPVRGHDISAQGTSRFSRKSPLPSVIAIYVPIIYTAHCVMFLMRADPLRGQVEGGWAMEIESFLGPVKRHRVDSI